MLLLHLLPLWLLLLPLLCLLQCLPTTLAMSSPLRSSTPTCPTPRTTPTTPPPPLLCRQRQAGPLFPSPTLLRPLLSTLLLLSRQLHQWPMLLPLSMSHLLLCREASTTPRTMLGSTALGTTTEAP